MGLWAWLGSFPHSFLSTYHGAGSVPCFMLAGCVIQRDLFASLNLSFIFYKMGMILTSFIVL